MKSSAKAKSFHVAVRGSSPQHVTLPSRTLIRAVGNLTRKGSSESSAESSPSIEKRSTHYLPVTQTSSQRPSPIERSVERAVATEPRTILQAIKRVILRAILRAILQTMPRANRSNTRKPSGRPRACVVRTATAILASRQAAPGLASNEPPRYLQSSGVRRTCALKRDMPKRRKRDDGRSGKVAEGYVRGSRV